MDGEKQSFPKSHEHDWSLWLTDQEASYSKRDDGQTPDKWFTVGDVFTCKERLCRSLWFVPHDSRLVAVEVNMEEESGNGLPNAYVL